MKKVFLLFCALLWSGFGFFLTPVFAAENNSYNAYYDTYNYENSYYNNVYTSGRYQEGDDMLQQYQEMHQEQIEDSYNQTMIIIVLSVAIGVFMWWAKRFKEM